MAKSNSNPVVRFAGFSDDWETNEVSHLLEERNIQAPKSEEYPLMAFIAHKGVAPKGDRYNREFLVTDQDNKKYKQTELGDFIYSSNNLETGSIGLNNFGKASISPVYSIFRPTDNADSDFIGRLLTSQPFIKQMVRWRQGVVYGQWRIHESDFLRIKVSYPGLKEQSKIGRFLKNFDSEIELSKLKLAKLEAIKSSMLERMFPESGLNVPHIRFKGFINEWRKRRLADLSSLITKGTTPLNKSNKGEISFVKVENIDSASGNITVTSKISYDEHNGYLKRSQLQENDILFSIAGTLGRVAIVSKNILPANTNQALSIVRLSRAKVSYIATYLKGKAIRDYIKRNPTVGAQPNLSLEQVGELIIPLPDDEEQIKIGSYFQKIDDLIILHKTELEKLTRLKIAFFEKMTSAATKQLK